MSTRIRLLPVLCACATVLAAATATASASVETLGFVPGGAVTANSAGVISFTAGAITIRCRVVLEAELLSSIVPTAGERLGSVTRATASSCEGGERPTVTFLSLSWSVTYNSFSGTQPEGMTAVLGTIRGLSGSLSVSGLTCLYRGEVGISVALSGENPYRDGTISTLTNSLSLVSGVGCPSTASISGRFELASAEDLAEYQSLPLIASPRSLTRSLVRLGTTRVTFSPATANVFPITGRFRVNASGWSTEIPPCLRLIVYPGGSCQLEFAATATAVDNELYLYDNTGLVASVPLAGM